MGANGPEPDPARLLAGHPQDEKLTEPSGLSGPWIAATNANLTAWAGPWGISYATNLTPEETTGMKIWTEDMFLSAMKTGRHFGQSRPILPPMPWQTLAQLSDDDLKAIYAYLRTIPPVKNLVPDPLIAGAPTE
jgi:hypothetical protein